MLPLGTTEPCPAPESSAAGNMMAAADSGHRKRAQPELAGPKPKEQRLTGGVEEPQATEAITECAECQMRTAAVHCIHCAKDLCG